MPPKDFVSITISQSHADRLQKVREHLVQHGIAALPVDYRPTSSTTVNAGTVIEAALLVLEHVLELAPSKVKVAR